ETQKQQLLSETLKNSKDFAKGVGSSEAVDAIKTQISKYDENISQIRNDKDTKVASLRQEVQTLETKLQDAKQKEQLDSVISENKVTTSNLPEDLFKKDGALAGKEDQVAEIAEKYGLEPEFLAAIMCLETGYGSSSLLNSCNNPGGTTGSGSAGSYTTSDGRTFAKYNSIEDGIEAMAKNLSGYTKYEGVSSVDIDHVDAIGNKYCVGGDWANKVRTIYNKIKA
ncbi:MAG: glucosaminidase domain-containing protein, partial [bacterium]|nr:glucosaminidase domain-containing protein [bacterium]